MITRIEDIKNTISESDLAEMEACKSEDGEYIIPVQWSVYATVRVTADNLKDALIKAAEKIDDLPTSCDNEYIEDSYEINIDSADSAITAQSYEPVSDVSIDSDGNVHT